MHKNCDNAVRTNPALLEMQVACTQVVVSKHIDAGSPFELRYVSNGEAQRISRLEGTVEVTRAGVLIDRHSIENTGVFRTKKASRPKDPRQKIYGNELFSIPAQPAGSEVVVRGTLEPRSQSGSGGSAGGGTCADYCSAVQIYCTGAADPAPALGARSPKEMNPPAACATLTP
jgi:hypothetical protein